MSRSTLLRVIFAVALAGSLGLEFLGEKKSPAAPWDYPLFFALTGVIGCILLSVVAKGIVSPVLDREQGFYDTDAAEYEELDAHFAAGTSGGDAPGGDAHRGDPLGGDPLGGDTPGQGRG
jgi:hypothetical protein